MKNLLLMVDISPSIYENLILFFNMMYGKSRVIMSAQRDENVGETIMYIGTDEYEKKIPNVQLSRYGSFYMAAINSDVLAPNGYYGDFTMSPMWGITDHNWSKTEESRQENKLSREAWNMRGEL